MLAYLFNTCLSFRDSTLGILNPAGGASVASCASSASLSLDSKAIFRMANKATVYPC